MRSAGGGYDREKPRHLVLAIVKQFPAAFRARARTDQGAKPNSKLVIIITEIARRGYQLSDTLCKVVDTRAYSFSAKKPDSEQASEIPLAGSGFPFLYLPAQSDDSSESQSNSWSHAF